MSFHLILVILWLLFIIFVPTSNDFHIVNMIVLVIFVFGVGGWSDFNVFVFGASFMNSLLWIIMNHSRSSLRDHDR